MSLRRYDKKESFSYCLGVYPTIELFKERPRQILDVFVDPKGKNNSGVREIIKLAGERRIRVDEGQKILPRLSGKENVYAGVRFAKYESPLEQDKPHVVLTHPENMGNLGTILRTMKAFGYSDLALIRPAADIFDPKVVRSSMGSLFSINFGYFNSLEDYTKRYSDREILLFSPSGKNDIEEIKPREKFSLVFGSESSGFSKKDSQLGKTVRIRFSEEIDSLNLSIAAGITLHHFKLI